MSTTDASFYDLAMTGPDEPAMLPLEDTPWLHVYETAAGMLTPSNPVVDLGSGTGRFAQLLRRRGFGKYVGMDFSQAAVDESHSYVPLFDLDTAWDASFVVADLREIEVFAESSNTAFVSLEVLEHLDEDLGLVAKIPPGHQFVFSVPNYWSAAHLRIFRGLGDVFERYACLLDFRAWRLIELDDAHAIHVCDSVRRTDAW